MERDRLIATWVRTATAGRRAGRPTVNLAHLKGDFDGHPFRGNQYTTGEGAGGETMVSPNIEEGLDIDRAVKAMLSERHERMVEAFTVVDDILGVQGKIEDAIGAWKDGAEDSTLTEYPRGVTEDLLKTAAAMKGLLAEQKAVLWFMDAPEGKAGLFSTVVKGKLEDLNQSLLKHGIENHTLTLLGGGRVKVTVFDYDAAGPMATSFSKFTEAHNGSELRVRIGNGDFLGSWTSREEGRAEYERQIASYLSTRSTAAEQWRRLRDNGLAPTAGKAVDLSRLIRPVLGKKYPEDVSSVAMIKEFVAPKSATSGLAGYSLEGQRSTSTPADSAPRRGRRKAKRRFKAADK